MRKILTSHKLEMSFAVGLLILGALFLMGESLLAILAFGSALALAGIIWAGAYEDENVASCAQSE